MNRRYFWATGATPRIHWACVDCARNTVSPRCPMYYMVHDHVWSWAGMHPRGGMLCWPCLEARLGVLLTEADFTSAPVNRGPDFNVYAMQRDGFHL